MTSTLLIVPADAAAVVPWRNGGGSTRELLTRPGGSDWLLRISLADIQRDGPFSSFAGTQRWFAVVAGAGVVLRFAERAHTLTADTPALQFDAAAGPDCSLLDGPTRDLNLMVRAGSAAMLQVQAGVDWTEPFNERGLFTLCAGTLHSGPQGGVELAPFTLAWHLRQGTCRFVPRSPGRLGWWLGWSAAAVREGS